MPRAARKAPGGLVYHVMNRSVGKMQLFGHDADFQAFHARHDRGAPASSDLRPVLTASCPITGISWSGRRPNATPSARAAQAFAGLPPTQPDSGYSPAYSPGS